MGRRFQNQRAWHGQCSAGGSASQCSATYLFSNGALLWLAPPGTTCGHYAQPRQLRGNTYSRGIAGQGSTALAQLHYILILPGCDLVNRPTPIFVLLDFAFDIHDSLGLHARRGIINGRTRQLKTRLLDGDQVVVETSEKPEVLPKWLEWGVTPRTRNSIRRYLRNKIRAS